MVMVAVVVACLFEWRWLWLLFWLRLCGCLSGGGVEVWNNSW